MKSISLLKASTAAAFFFLFAISNVSARTLADENYSLYEQLKAFTLSGGSAAVQNVVLKRDRAEMTFTGTFWFTSDAGGRVTGAVFIGNGSFRAAVPDSDFEKAQVRRLIGSDDISSDFSRAVLRFSDDTFAVIGANVAAGAPSAEAQKLADEYTKSFLKDTGGNSAARIALAVANGESKGVFLAEFDGGKRGRFGYIFDPQNRIPTAHFNINGGEKGLIYKYTSSMFDNEVWLAFYGLEDYEKNTVSYSDINDLVDITHYESDIDLTSPSKRLGLRTDVEMVVLADGLAAIPFIIGENLGTRDEQRRNKQMRLTSAKLNGDPLKFAQEEWEGGFLVFLPEKAKAGQKITIEFEMEGDFIRQSQSVSNCHYPRSNTSWYPRHGYLDRSTYALTFNHSKSLKVAAVGVRTSEERDPEDNDVVITKYEMRHPIALATFALGPFERHTEQIKWDTGEEPIMLEFNSLPGAYMAIKESFILAELNNTVRYFHALFGPYPYDTFSATFHPYGFGQGFPSMLMMPPTDRDSKYTFAFVSHETAHQWWGNIVAWRSYRDQWLSEGFAEYSGILYTGLRRDYGAAKNMVEQMRGHMTAPPRTQVGLGKGRLTDVGPLILGHRLASSETLDAYGVLVYEKGALVLRMLHFLLSDPSSMDDKGFYDMMKDFVERHRNKVASTDDFRMVAGEHFAKSPIGRKYGLQNLDWFFSQWVYDSKLPSYKLEYQIEDKQGGGVTVKGTVLQEDAGEKWFMPLPLVFDFGGKQVARGTVYAYGPSTPFSIDLPMKPKGVNLDPDKWILSDKTSESKK